MALNEKDFTKIMKTFVSKFEINHLPAAKKLKELTSEFLDWFYSLVPWAKNIYENSDSNENYHFVEIVPRDVYRKTEISFHTGFIENEEGENSNLGDLILSNQGINISVDYCTKANKWWLTADDSGRGFFASVGGFRETDNKISLQDAWKKLKVQLLKHIQENYRKNSQSLLEENRELISKLS